jgi:hypothetical protein
MEASSGRFEIKAPVGRLMAASNGRYLTGAPTGRFMVASNGRSSCQVEPTGRCHQASNGRFNLKAPTGASMERPTGAFRVKRPMDGLVPIVQWALHQGCVQRTLLKRLLDAFTKKRPADKRVFEKPAPWCNRPGLMQGLWGCSKRVNAISFGCLRKIEEKVSIKKLAWWINVLNFKVSTKSGWVLLVCARRIQERCE